MALNVTLAQLVDQVRAEIGASVNPAQGTGQLAQIQQTIRRTQARLYAEFNWPHLFGFRDENLQPGERYYTFNTDVNFDKITKAEVYYTTSWRPVCYGIENQDYNLTNSETGQRSDPVMKWQHYDRNQFEVWPIPDAAGQVLRFRAMLNLRPLLANEDQCDLDSDMLVLFAAAEILTKLKSADAGAKQQLAASHYKNIRGNQLKTNMFILGGGLRNSEAVKPWPDNWTIRVPGQ